MITDFQEEKRKRIGERKKMFQQHYNENQKNGLDYACQGMHRDYSRKASLYPDAFLRKPYAGTKAETKDNTQYDLHKDDYLKI